MSRGSVKPPLLGIVSAVIAAGVIVFVLARSPELGPKDGEDLPPSDLDRVAVGEMAPDFSLLAYSGDIISLSDYRGEKNVVLVFYRGHW
jgi:cytochrome oxidase Cu insertion factor (SCO1/SenC/PrrC family)